MVTLKNGKRSFSLDLYTQKTELIYVLLVVHFPKLTLSYEISLKGLYWVLYCFCYT